MSRFSVKIGTILSGVGVGFSVGCILFDSYYDFLPEHTMPLVGIGMLITVIGAVMVFWWGHKN